MKLVVQVKLLPTPEQAAALAATLALCNTAANEVSAVAFAHGVFARQKLQKLVYTDLKARGLSAQPALHVIRKVADAYTALHAQIEAGLLGGEHSRQRRKATSKPITVRADAAQPFDDRCLSWQMDARTISIWTARGRVRDIAFTGEPGQLKFLADHRKGETDLVHRDGMFFLIATCEIEQVLRVEPADWIGVDRGIVNLATTSDGDNHQGKGLARYRRRQARLRAQLQAKKAAGSRSAARRLARRAQREARHAANENHKISKSIVTDARRTGRGIALEELSGIRDRVRLRRHQRATHSSWPFHQLGTFIQYKAQRAGVPFLEVDPAYTSQRCPVPWCGHTERADRPDRNTFCCRRCGFAGPADVIAAMNIRKRACVVWAFVSMPVPTPKGGQGRCDPGTTPSRDRERNKA
ncbi:RNA-guided endonuclease TnpB family protein [Actinoallomurus liliacearum]|uniref:RNA-guided endonuclease TnpB family protein n=1 Tax=Actinoallomurus liliacearum TaxID=1080073 RepID=A0ABP8U0R2_9ACTN